MRIRFEELDRHLQAGLKPIYVIAGDEPYQKIEAVNTIYSHAQQQGYDEREVLSVGPGFDWGQLQASSHNLSLFAQRRIVELRLLTGKPGSDGAKALLSYASRPPMDTLLIIQAGKLDRMAEQRAWFKAVDKIGTIVQIWPLSHAETVAWVARRMRKFGMRPNEMAVTLLTAKLEGNLLAAAQEIEKLSLLVGTGPVDVNTIMEAVGDSARFNVFDLAEAVLAGNSERTVQILTSLQAEDVKPPLILWSLSEQVRELVRLAFEKRIGQMPRMVPHSIRGKRGVLMKKALSRYSSQDWDRVLRRCAKVDKVIKGLEKDKVWDELLQLALDICGQRLLNMP